MTLEIIDKRVAMAWLIDTAFYSQTHSAFLQQFANAAFRCSDRKEPMKPVLQVFSLINKTDSIEEKRILRSEMENVIAALIETGCDVSIEARGENPSKYIIYSYK